MVNGSVAEPIGAEFFVDGAGADIKFDTEPMILSAPAPFFGR